MSDKLKESIGIVLLVACIILCVCLNKSCNKIKEQQNFQDLLTESQDSLHKTHNKLGQEVASKELLYGTIDNFKKIHFADSSNLGKLQKMVDKLSISVTVLQTSTAGTDKGNTVIITKHDTVKIDNKIMVFPEYAYKDSSKWQKFDIVARHDSTTVKYKVYNEFDVKSEWVSQGFLKKKKATIMVTNINPNTTTRDIQNFTVDPPKNSVLKSAAVGFGLGMMALKAFQIFLIHK